MKHSLSSISVFWSSCWAGRATKKIDWPLRNRACGKSHSQKYQNKARSCWRKTDCRACRQACRIKRSARTTGRCWTAVQIGRWGGVKRPSELNEMARQSRAVATANKVQADRGAEAVHQNGWAAEETFCQLIDVSKRAQPLKRDVSSPRLCVSRAIEDQRWCDCFSKGTWPTCEDVQNAYRSIEWHVGLA